jgi:hypothetical protein
MIEIDGAIFFRNGDSGVTDSGNLCANPHRRIQFLNVLKAIWRLWDHARTSFFERNFRSNAVL